METIEYNKFTVVEPKPRNIYVAFLLSLFFSGLARLAKRINIDFRDK